MTQPTTASTRAKADWHFDFISPNAYLQFSAHPDLFDDLDKSAGLVFKPVVFAGLFARWGHKGPVAASRKGS